MLHRAQKSEGYTQSLLLLPITIAYVNPPSLFDFDKSALSFSGQTPHRPRIDQELKPHNQRN